MENGLRKLMKIFELDPTVGSIDTDLLSRYSGPFGGQAPTGRRWRRVPIPRNSMENSLRKFMKKFERDPTVGSINTDVLSLYSFPVIRIASTAHRQRVVRIPRNSMENNIRKLVKKFDAIQRSDL